MRLCHTLVQERSAVAAEQNFQPAAQQTIPLEGYQRILLSSYLNLTLQMEVIADKASGSAMTQLRFELELDYLLIIH